MGPLDQYYDIPKGKKAEYIIYNPDEAFETQDLINSDFRNKTHELALGKNYDKESMQLSITNEAA